MGNGNPASDADARTAPQLSSGALPPPASTDLTWQASAGFAPEARIDLERFPTVPGYEILEVLGSGGMGVVYKARQLALNRLVALKMIEGPGSRDPRYRRRFQAEAEAVARLDHPGIVQIHEIGSQNDIPYIAFEYVEGGSLSRRRPLFPLPHAEAAWLVEQVARAIQHAHEHGIIHRDLKPANILLDANGQPHLSDFGVAKHVDGDEELTRTGQTLGTPQYMAPEQAIGARQAGPAADIYALGVILYEMLTGQLPFIATAPVGALAQAMTSDPRPPTWLRPELPVDLEAICLRCLERRPEERYASAAALADDLARYRRGEPIRARRNTVAERLRKWTRRQPALAAALAGIFLVLTLGVVVSTWFALSAREFAHQAVAAQEEAENRLYTSTIARAWLEWGGNANLRETRLLLDDPRLKPRRGWEWGYLQKLCGEDGASFSGHSGWVHAVTWSPDGRMLTSVGGGNAYWHNQGPNAVIRAGETLLHNPRDGKLLRSLGGHTNVVRSVAFRPDGRVLVTAGDDRTIRFHEVDTGRELRRLDGLPSIVSSVAYRPDGQCIAWASWNGGFQVYDLERDAPILTKGDVGMPVAQTVFSPDGRWLATALGRDGSGSVQLWDLKTGQSLLALPSDEVGQPTSLAFRPDGTQLAVGTLQGVRIHELPGGRLRTLLPHAGGVNGVSFSPQGDLLASAGLDRTVRLWQGTTGHEVRVCRGHLSAVRCVAFHPNGNLVASGDMEGNVRLWELALVPEHAPLRLPWHFAEVEALAFSADGRHLFSAERPGQIITTDCTRDRIVAEQRAPLLNVWLTPAEPISFDGSGRVVGGIPSEDSRGAALWDVVSGRRLVTLSGHRMPVWHVHLSADGQRVATVATGRARSDPKGATVRVWDASGKLLLERGDAAAGVGRVALNTDGSLLAISWLKARVPEGVDSWIQIFDVARNELVSEIRVAEDRVYALRFDPLGRRLAAAGMDRRLVLHDLTTKESVELTEGPVGTMDLAFSPDGSRLALASRFQVKLHKADTGEELLTLRSQQPAPPNAGFNPRVCFSPDGQRLAAVLQETGEPINLWSLTPELPAERGAAAERRALLWHLEQAIRSKGPEHRQARAFHLAQLPEELPDRWFHRLRGIELFARSGQWRAAVADLRRNYTMAPPASPRDWRAYIALLLWADCQEEARTEARRMVEHFTATGERLSPRHLALVGGLAPDFLQLADAGSNLAEKIQPAANDSESRLFQALAFLRLGRPAEALSCLERLERREPTWRYLPLCLLVRVLVHQSLHQDSQAQAALQRIRQLLGDHWSPNGSTAPEHVPTSWNWEWWLRFRLLQCEVE